MNFKKKTVKLRCIDLKDDACRITTKAETDDLVVSINDLGVLNSPYLIKKNEKLIIVCGFRRIAACKRLGLPDIAARILDSDTKKIDCAKLAIADNTFQRQLNLIETSRSLHLLSGFFHNGEKFALAKEASNLGLPENPGIISKITGLCLLPWPVQNGILKDAVSLVAAIELGRLPEQTCVALANLFCDLKLSTGKQREVITFVKEIAARENIFAQDVISDDGLQKILNNDDLDRTQKTAKIRAFLRKRRFPAITEAERAFKQNLSGLKLRNRAKLVPPANFEGTTYTLSFDFKNLEELKNHKRAFDGIIQNPALEKILNYSIPMAR